MQNERPVSIPICNYVTKNGAAAPYLSIAATPFL